MPSTVGALFPSTGNREDLLDIISVVDAKNTPISSSIAKVGADLNNPGLYSYQAQSYNAPSFDGIVDSADVSEFDDPTKNRVLLSARSQKFRRTIRVSDFQQLTDVAGIGKRKEMAKGTAVAITELKRDVEAAISSDNDSQEGSGATPYKTRGLGKWIAAYTGSGDLPVPTSQATPSGSIDNTATASFTESKLQDVLQSIYEETGTTDRLVMVAGPTMKKAVTNFTRFTVNSTSNVFNLRQTTQNAESGRLVSHVSLYEGDFSSVEIVPSLLLAAGAATDAEKFARAYIVNPDHLMLRYGRRPAFRELQDGGGGPRGIVDCIVSLACLTPRGMGKLNATS